MRLHTASGEATIEVLMRIGLLADIVFGVTSPNNRSNGNMTMTLIHAACSGPYNTMRMPAMLTVAAILTSSLPQRIEMIRRRGSSNKACSVSDLA